MDSQKKTPARLALPMEEWLTPVEGEDRLIAWSRTQEWRHSDFRRDVTALIAQLQQQASHRWALCFNDSYYFAVALLAVLYCNKLPVLPGHQRQAQLEEQQPEFDALLTDCALKLQCPALILPTAILAVEQVDNRELPSFPQDASLVLFTSGSTGTPQKIIKSVASLQTESQWLVQRWGKQLHGARFVATVSSQHMYGLTFRFMLPLGLGLPFYSSSLEVHEQLVFMANQFSLALVSSPTFLQRLDDRLNKISSVQIFSAGGPLAAKEAARVQQLCGVYPTDIYGTTETSIIASRQQQHEGTPWTLFDGVKLCVEPENRVRVFSELILQPGGIELSDNIELAVNGREFHLIGRKDRIVKIAEQRLSLSEIEHRLCQLPTIDDACVITIEKNGRPYIAAAVVLSASARQQLQQQSHSAVTLVLRQSLRPWLAAVALPRFWRFLPEIPLNQQGKRAYAELKELFL